MKERYSVKAKIHVKTNILCESGREGERNRRTDKQRDRVLERERERKRQRGEEEEKNIYIYIYIY